MHVYTNIVYYKIVCKLTTKNITFSRLLRKYTYIRFNKYAYRDLLYFTVFKIAFFNKFLKKNAVQQ